MGAMLILAAFAILILILSAGAASASVLKDSGAPLVDALVKVYGHGMLANFVNFVGLAGLIASFSRLSMPIRGKFLHFLVQVIYQHPYH